MKNCLFSTGTKILSLSLISVFTLWGCEKETAVPKNSSASTESSSVCPSDMTIYFDGIVGNTNYWYAYEVTSAGDTVLLQTSVKHAGLSYTGDIIDDLQPGCFELPMLVGHTYLFVAHALVEQNCITPTFKHEYMSVKFTGVSHGKLVARYNMCSGSFSVTEKGSNIHVRINPYTYWAGITSNL